ncbi:MAG: hypothetical protein AAF492_09335, partial [Verrucomicrobiota bacterium]
MSPQFHVTHEDLFETVQKGPGFTNNISGLMPIKSKWQLRTGFTKGNNIDNTVSEGVSLPQGIPELPTRIIQDEPTD